MRTDPATTVVLDAGARYGIHPSWSDFHGDLHYLAFEPDKEEAAYLRELHPKPWYEVIDIALSKDGGDRDFYITRHCGLCSFLEPDREGEFYRWYMRSRPGEGDVERVIRVQTCSVDQFARERELRLDFLKVDTEGTEVEVLAGADEQLAENVLGVRASASFQPFYKNQPLFPETHTYLLSKGFFLVNLDYFGVGQARNSLFRKPDPTAPEDHRYGVLLNADGVWLKYYERLHDRYAGRKDELALATLKYAYFCMLNNAPDLGIDTLLSFIRDRKGQFSPAVAASRLYLRLREACAKFLGRWRVVPDRQWEEVRGMFRTIFGLNLEGGSGYWKQIRSL